MDNADNVQNIQKQCLQIQSFVQYLTVIKDKLSKLMDLVMNVQCIQGLHKIKKLVFQMNVVTIPLHKKMVHVRDAQSIISCHLIVEIVNCNHVTQIRN